MANVIPNVVNWSVTPVNGQANYFTLMNTWLSESTTVISSLDTAIDSMNISVSEVNDNTILAETARDESVVARDEAVSAIATLTAGSIDDTTIATNKAYSNSKVNDLLDNKANSSDLDLKIDKDINSLTSKIIPVDNDELLIADSVTLFSLKKLSWNNLKATLLTYFDTLYSRTTSIFGIGQNWQDVTASRSAGVTYTNTTGKPIYVSITQNQNNAASATLTIDGIIVSYSANKNTNNTNGLGMFVCGIVPNNSTYLYNQSASTVVVWGELR